MSPYILDERKEARFIGWCAATYLIIIAAILVKVSGLA